MSCNKLSTWRLQEGITCSHLPDPLPNSHLNSYLSLQPQPWQTSTPSQSSLSTTTTRPSRQIVTPWRPSMSVLLLCLDPPNRVWSCLWFPAWKLHAHLWGRPNPRQWSNCRKTLCVSSLLRSRVLTQSSSVTSPCLSQRSNTRSQPSMLNHLLAKTVSLSASLASLLYVFLPISSPSHPTLLC